MATTSSRLSVIIPVIFSIIIHNELPSEYHIFGFIFGENWASGGIYVALLIPHLMTNFVFEHLAVLFVVTADHKAKLVWDVLKFLAMVVTFVSAKLAGWSPEACILILSLAWGVLHVALVPITFRALDRPGRSLKSPGEIG